MSKEEAILFSEKIGGLTSRQEKEALWDLSMKHIQEGGVAIEVGTWTGGSSVIIGEVCKQKNARLICVDKYTTDMHSAKGPIAIEALNSVLVHNQYLPVDYMVGNSIDFVNYIKPELADFIFVDGDHHYPNVKTDIQGYWYALKEGGCYFMHDYTNPCDVKQVVNEFFGTERLHHVDSSVYILK